MKGIYQQLKRILGSSLVWMVFTKSVSSSLFAAPSPELQSIPTITLGSSQFPRIASNRGLAFHGSTHVLKLNWQPVTGLSLSARVQNIRTALKLQALDGRILEANIPDTPRWSFDLRLERKSLYSSIGAMIDAHGRNAAASLEMGRSGKSLALVGALNYAQSTWDTRVGNETQMFSGALIRSVYSVKSGMTLKLHGHAWEMEYATDVSPFKKISSTPQESFMWSHSHPGFLSASIKWSLPPSWFRNTSLLVEIMSDTTNADIMIDNQIKGKIYNLNMEQDRVRLERTQQWGSMGIEGRAIRADLSGYVSAAPFGNVLSALSGARYYQQSALELEMFELWIDALVFTRETSTLDINSKWVAARGSISNRDYIWQLFNPLTDFHALEITVDAAVLAKLEVEFIQRISPRFQILGSCSQWIPLYVDYEATPAENALINDYQVRAEWALTLEFNPAFR